VTAQIIPFPSTLSRVDLLCRAVAEDKGPRELITFEAHPDSVCVRVAGLELWLTPEEATDLAVDLVETARDAEALV
jgi:hypothetical protein